MKKSNKVSVFYALSSVFLFLLMIGGGIYGVYVSIGLNFVKSSVSNITDGVGNASNVSYGGSVNFESSMVGIIILSIALIVLSILDFISLIKQISFFKQFKMVRESNLEKKIEKKTKSRAGLIFFVVILDIISFATGIAGIFVNMHSLVGNYIIWILYAVDVLVSIFALISLVLLVVKLKSRKKNGKAEDEQKIKGNEDLAEDDKNPQKQNQLKEYKFGKIDVDDIEYKLLKLKNLKASKMISNEEYQKLHDHLLGEDSKPQPEEKPKDENK